MNDSLKLIVTGIEIIPNQYMSGKNVIMLDKDNNNLGVVNIENGPFHKDMKKMHMSYELVRKLEDQLGDKNNVQVS